jgi:hypothetical protein
MVSPKNLSGDMVDQVILLPLYILLLIETKYENCYNIV